MAFLKKRFKRVTSMGLALLLVVSVFPSAAFAASESTLAEVTAKFLDAENGKEIVEPETYRVTHEEKSPQEIENYTYVDYSESVEYVYSHKDLTYIVGYPDESVRADAPMTRAEAATVFYRLYDGDYPAFEHRMSGSTFEDVQTGHWFYKEVETLYNSGIVDGTGEHTFKAKGKQVLSQGWRAIQEVFRFSLKEKPEDEDDEGVLPALTEGQIIEPVSASVTEHFTSPPKPYTEDTLLSAMENAGKEDMPDEAERKGLGTPATRAAIIEKLVSGGFVERKGKNLIPTKAGVNLVTVLPELLTSPKLTADWEQRLNEVAKSQASPDDFMDGIEAMAAELVRKYSHISEDGQKLFQPEKETVGLCPRCGKPVYEGKKNFACSDRACQFVMWKNDRFFEQRGKVFTAKIAAALLKDGKAKVKGLCSLRTGKLYDGIIVLADTGGKYVNYRIEK